MNFLLINFKKISIDSLSLIAKSWFSIIKQLDDTNSKNFSSWDLSPLGSEEFNKMFVTYGIEYKSLDKPAYIVEEFTYLKDNKPGLYIEIYYQLEPIIVEFAHTTYGMFDKQYLDGTDSVDVYINSIIVKTNNLSKPISAKKYIKIAKEINYICKNK